MTICVLAFDGHLQQFRCIADTRIRVGDATATDSGAKILPVPVAAYAPAGNARFAKSEDHTFGFAFAGSTLAAINTHALATACSQSLTKKDGAQPDPPPICMEELAELFRQSAEHYILDMSSRLATPNQPIGKFFFQAALFGFCPRSQAFKAFAISPNTAGETVKVIMAHMQVDHGGFHPFGSGFENYLRVMEELRKSNQDSNVVATMLELIRREERDDVGGHIQIGIADRNGFSLIPVLTRSGQAHFFGVNIEGECPLQGYRIGFNAFMPNYK